MTDATRGRLARMLDPWARGGLAGLLSGLLAIGVSELYAGIFGGLPSLLVSMSGRIVDLSPRAMEEFAISVFGTSDKLALVIFLVVLSAIFGTTFGVVALWSRPAAVAGFAAFGILAGLGERVRRPIYAGARVSRGGHFGGRGDRGALVVYSPDPGASGGHGGDSGRPDAAAATALSWYRHASRGHVGSLPVSLDAT